MSGIAVSPSGDIYVATVDEVQDLGPDGTARTVIASGLDGPATLAVSPNGVVAIAEAGANDVREVNSSAVSVVAGPGPRLTTKQAQSNVGDGGPAVAAHLLGPSSVAFERDGRLLIGDSLDGRVRAVAPDGTITTVAGSGLDKPTPDGIPAVEFTLDSTKGLAADAAGDIYIADTLNIRKVAPDGVLTTIAGNGTAQSTGDGGPATAAGVEPEQLALDGAGNLYVAEGLSNRVRRIAPDGTITTFAGSSPAGAGGPAPTVNMTLDDPDAVAVDSAGNVYIGDDRALQKVAPSGAVTTILGGEQGGVATTTPSSSQSGAPAPAEASPADAARDFFGDVAESKCDDAFALLAPTTQQLLSTPSSFCPSTTAQQATIGATENTSSDGAVVAVTLTSPTSGTTRVNVSCVLEQGGWRILSFR